MIIGINPMENQLVLEKCQIILPLPVKALLMVRQKSWRFKSRYVFFKMSGKLDSDPL